MASRLAASAVTADQVRADFDALARQAADNGEAIVVEGDNIPSVVILATHKYEELLREARVARFEQASMAAGLEAERRGLTEEQLEREMEEIRQQLFQERYG